MVSEYKKSCGYAVGTLKDFVYLIPYSADRFSYSIDNGMCSEVAMNDYAGVVRIEGFQTSLKNTETLEGRFKYESEVGIYIHETLGKNLYDRLRYLIQNRWFVVVEDMQGVQYIQSVEFYSEFEYNISLTDQNNAQNRIQLRFKGSSNFPSMIMGHNISKGLTTALIEKDCRFMQGGVRDFKMCESGYVIIKENNHEISKIDTTGGRSFKNIDFIQKSFTYTQNYANGQYEDTITFSIPLSDYKYYWHYNIIEFKDNRYVATFRTSNDNMYVIGFSDGASASYVIESSNAVNTLNKITITLKYIGSDGLYISSKDDSIFGTDDTTTWKPAPDMVNGVITKDCIGNGMAVITLIQRYTSSGTPLNEYLVLEGYADRFASLNIVGIYSLSDDVGFPLTVAHPSCVGGLCNTKNSISNPYSFSSYAPTHSFDFTTECDYKFVGLPSWLAISPNGSGFEMSLGDTLPTESTGTTFYIETADSVRYPIIVNYTASGDTTGWDVYPREFYVSHDEQYITITYTGDVGSNDFDTDSDTLALVSITDIIIVKVPANDTNNIVYHFFTITNKNNGESIEVKVIQSPSSDDWRVVSGYYCEDGDKYTKLELYIGDKPTQVYKAGMLIERDSSDCVQTFTRWVQFDTICDGVNEYQNLKEQKSTDNGLTWTDTGETRKGALTEANSEHCNPDHVKWQNTGDHLCSNGHRCEVWAKYVDGVITDETSLRNCVLDPDGCPIDFPTKWELSLKTQCVDRGNGICDSWFLEEQFITYNGGITWESLGIFKISNNMAVKDDEACNCPKHDKYKFERWVWDGIGYLCDDPMYDCSLNAIWIPYGFKYSIGTLSGEWEDKTITEVKAPCDFNVRIADMSNMAKDCGQLVKFETLDCSGVKRINNTFENCTMLEDMPLSNLGNVERAVRTFYGCRNLTGSYKVPMPKLEWIQEPFKNSGIKGWDFGGAKLRWKPGLMVQGSVIESIKGLDYSYVSDPSESSEWWSRYLETLEITNIGTDFDFSGLKVLSRASIQYMYEHAKSGVQMTWTYGSENIQKWGSVPTGKSNIKWVKV